MCTGFRAFCMGTNGRPARHVSARQAPRKQAPTAPAPEFPSGQAPTAPIPPHCPNPLRQAPADAAAPRAAILSTTTDEVSLKPGLICACLYQTVLALLQQDKYLHILAWCSDRHAVLSSNSVDAAKIPNQLIARQKYDQHMSLMQT